MRLSAVLGTLLLLIAALSTVGCDNKTCQNACSQYYGTSAGQCQRPSVLTDGTSSDKARNNCITDCRAALYRTTTATGSNQNDGGYARLENETDAIEFIDCIVDQDYSDAVFNQTCEDLFFDCPWIKW